MRPFVRFPVQILQHSVYQMTNSPTNSRDTRRTPADSPHALLSLPPTRNPRRLHSHDATILPLRFDRRALTTSILGQYDRRNPSPSTVNDQLEHKRLASYGPARALLHLGPLGDSCAMLPRYDPARPRGRLSFARSPGHLRHALLGDGSGIRARSQDRPSALGSDPSALRGRNSPRLRVFDLARTSCRVERRDIRASRFQ